MDAGGVAVDTAAVLLPGVPGGAGATMRAARAGTKRGIYEFPDLAAGGKPYV